MQKRTFLTDNKPVSIDAPVTIIGLIVINSTDEDCIVTADNGDTFPCPAKVISTWSLPATLRLVAKLANQPASGNCNVIVTDAPTLNSTSQLATLSGGSTLKIQKNSALVGNEGTLNLIDNGNVFTWTVVDDAPNLRVNIVPNFANPIITPGWIASPTGTANKWLVFAQDVGGAPGGQTYAGFNWNNANLELDIEALEQAVAWRGVHLCRRGGIPKAAGLSLQRTARAGLAHIEAGQASVPAGAGGASITFAVAFATQVYVLATPVIAGTTCEVSVSGVSTTGATIIHNVAGTQAINWIAEGNN